MHIYLLSLHWIFLAKESQTSPSQCLHVKSTFPSVWRKIQSRMLKGQFHSPNYNCNWLLIVYLHPKSMFGSSTIHTVWKRKKRSRYSRDQHYLWYRTDVKIVIRASKLWEHRGKRGKPCNKNIKDFCYSVSTMAWTTRHSGMAKQDLILWAKPWLIFWANKAKFLHLSRFT